MADYKFLYTADVHGNKYQYLAAFEKAKELNLDAVVFGGDLAPKMKEKEDGTIQSYSSMESMLKAQKEFYNWMVPEFEKFTKETGIDVYAMLGNDDFKSNEKMLKKASEQGKFKLLNGNSYKINNKVDIVGNSYVDLTPFKIKDWEMWDLSSDTVADNLYNDLHGYLSNNNEFSEIDFKKIDPKENSLEKYLSNRIKNLSDPQKTIYVFHAPPYKTNLDLLPNGVNAGSKAIKKYFEEQGGLLGLHGHIHEAVDSSGKYIDKIRDTTVASPGNHPYDHEGNKGKYNKKLNALLISLNGKEVENIERKPINYE